MSNRYRNHQMSIEESEAILEEKFLKTKEYLKKNPRSGSAANELLYCYFRKGMFLDHLVELILSENIDLVRTALAILSDIAEIPLQPSDVIDLLRKHNDSTIIARLINYSKRCLINGECSRLVEWCDMIDKINAKKETT